MLLIHQVFLSIFIGISIYNIFFNTSGHRIGTSELEDVLVSFLFSLQHSLYPLIIILRIIMNQLLKVLSLDVLMILKEKEYLHSFH
jgi:hypothetical protein